MQSHRPLSRLAFSGGRFAQGSRALPEEVAVALSYNGSTQAVMMATPDALEDFGYGFSLTEGIAQPAEIDSVTAVETERGIDLQIWLHGDAEARLVKRRLEEATRKAKPVNERSFTLTPRGVMAAVSALSEHQPLHDVTRAVHAAGFWSQGKMLAVREDVGRHNALDKLAGTLIRAQQPPGAVVITSRVSIDMVQKCAALGAPMLIAVSAPTTAAVAMADAAGITLIALARADTFEVFTHMTRITPEEAADVA